MSKTLLTIDEYLKSRASLKNKVIALHIAILAENRPKEVERLQSILHAYIKVLAEHKKYLTK